MKVTVILNLELDDPPTDWAGWIGDKIAHGTEQLNSALVFRGMHEILFELKD